MANINPESWSWLKEALESGRIGKRIQIEMGEAEMRVTYLDPVICGQSSPELPVSTTGPRDPFER